MDAIGLRLFTDNLAAGAELAPLEAGSNRILYVAEGGATVTAGGAVACLAPNSAWHGREALRVRAGARGARLLRFELGGPAGAGTPTLAAPIALEPAPAYLLRCDRVDFPPGGVAYTHTHRGPGIRCLQAGRIRIETGGTTHHYAPGEAWLESGPEPVFAAASEEEPTHFIRVMVLPRELLGRSSLRYIRPEDQDKPKRQSYQIFIDAPIELWPIEL